MENTKGNEPMPKSNRDRVVVVGATGLIGGAVVRRLEAAGYHVVPATHETSPALDLTDPDSMGAFFTAVGPIAHVVVAAGDARFGDLLSLDAAAFEVGLRSKLMGQVHVALAALRVLPSGGSVTLTSGELSHAPIAGSAAVALVNGALDSFVRAAALDAPAGRRINVVSPGWLTETLQRLGHDPAPGIPASEVARLYVQAIEGTANGRVFAQK